EQKPAIQQRPPIVSWGLRVDEGKDAFKITDADMTPLLDDILRRIMTGANGTSLSSVEGGGGSSSNKGIRVPLKVPLHKPSVNLTALGPFKIPVRNDPVNGIKQFGVLSKNGQKYRECVRRQQELDVWDRRNCMPTLKRGKGNLKMKNNKKQNDTDINSLDRIPWSQKVLRLIIEGKDIDDYLEEEISQSEKGKSNVRKNNSKQSRRKKKKKRKRGSESDVEAKCGYTYGVEPGDVIKFVMPKRTAFCEALFVASVGTSLSFSCKKFKLNFGCNEEYLYLSNGVYEV
ncbi:unnamed protein product, partial [Meganyctiphanes norvegica]